MTNLNEQDWKKLTDELEAIEIPKEALQQARVKGVQQYRQNKKRKRRLYSITSVAAIVLLLFATSIRVSPVFAQAVAKIPGFASIVDMISFDKGIRDIVKNNYYEELDIVVTKGDYTLTLQGVVADHSGMIISYKLKAPFDLSKLEGWPDVFVTQQGVSLRASSGSDHYPLEETTFIEQKLVIVSQEGLSYDNKTFEFNFKMNDAAKTTFTIPFTLKKPIERPKVYEIDQSVVVDGQKITVQQLKISPLRTEIKLAVDEQNSMQLLDFTSVRLIDENGEDWGGIRNGITGSGDLRDGEVSLFVQSNYFRQPKKLTLVMDKIEALPKGSDYIEVDFEQQKVLYVPNELDIDVRVPSSNALEVIYPTASQSHTKQLLYKVVDQKGTEYQSSETMTHFSEQEPYIKSTQTFDFDNEVNPIRLHIYSYPSYLDGKVELDIPLNK